MAEGGGARELSKQETREALLRSAMAEFAEHGLDAPSLDAICARAGFTRGAFYVHFRDREDLVAAVMERVLGAFLDALVARGEGERGLAATVERFAAAVSAQREARAQGRTAASEPADVWGAPGVPFHQVLAACSRSPELRRRFVSVLEEAMRRVSRAAGSEGRPDPDALATLLVLLALGVRAALDLDLAADVAAPRDALLRMLAASAPRRP
jgi:TetR/AcrR family transcriptional repressor of nem operon